MSRNLEDLDPDVRMKAEALITNALAVGIHLRVTQTYRTPEEQEAIYAIGRTVSGVRCHHRGEAAPRELGACPAHPLGLTVTHAPPGYSWHEFRRAFDVAEADSTPYDIGDPGEDGVDESWWERVGGLGEAVGLEWGGRWKHPDRPHFQDTAGRTLSTMRSLARIKPM